MKFLSRKISPGKILKFYPAGFCDFIPHTLMVFAFMRPSLC